MSDQCYVLEDVGHLGEAFTLARALTISDVGHVSESFSARRGVTLTDTATVEELYEPRATYTLGDTLTIGEAWTAVGKPTETLVDAARVRERFRLVREATLADAATAAELYTEHRDYTLIDVATVAEAYSPTAHPAETLVDAIAGSAAYSGNRSAKLVDILTGGEAWTIRRGASLSDTATIAELFEPAAHPDLALADVLTIGEAWTTFAHPTATLREEAVLSDGFILPALDATQGWSANTDSWAMSRYDEYPINSFVVVDGALHGACEDGLYRLDATKDDGFNIEAWLQTGEHDLGSDATKRLRVLYARARTNGALQVTVTDNTNGVATDHTFPFEDRPGDALGTQRAKLARGMRSTIYAFKVGNVAGSTMTLDELRLVADNGSRSI